MDIAQLFATSRTIAVVGLSMNQDRPSYDVARLMQKEGFRIIPVNPRYAGEQILGERCFAKLSDIDVAVDIVDCFRRSEEMVEIAQDAVAMKSLPRVLWMQLGVANEQAADIARAAGIEVVQNQCVEIEYFALRKEHA